MTDYAIVRVADKSIVQRFSGALPKALTLPNRKRIVSPVTVEHIGKELDGYRFVDVVETGFTKPGEFYDIAETDDTLSATTLTRDRTWTAWEQTRIDSEIAARKAAIVTQFDNVDAIVRLAVLVIMDELNRHATKTGDILQAAADATSLADFKARMGTISAVPQRTAQDLRNAIEAKLDNVGG